MEKSMYRKAFCEVLYIIEHTEKNVTKRIPQKLIDFFNVHKDKSYKVKLSRTLPLEEQELLEETKVILAILCRKYLGDNSRLKE